MANKSSLENVLKAILSVGNAEQNYALPPHIYDSHFNIVTSFLLDRGAELYPKNLDIFLPFMATEKIPVTSGYIKLPSTYRNLLGSPSISIKADGSDCSDNSPLVIDTASEFKTANLKSGCKSVPVRIVSKEEWDALTTSEYAYPTYDQPIGMFYSENGEKRIKVCPYDLARVEVMFLKKENIYRYGYINQPDDTYIYDANTSIESDWEEPAFEFLFKGCFALYANYSRDPAISNYSALLNQAGIF